MPATAPDVRRRACLATGLALLAGPALAAPPAVNLHVQWRWVDIVGAAGAGAAPAGLLVGTAEALEGRGVRSWRTRAGAAAERDALQQLWLRNGGRASVRLAELEPIAWLEMAHIPQGSVAALRYRWIERVSSLALRATWPGGRRSVDLELDAETGEHGLGAPGRGRLGTQLLVPPNEWVTVARSAAARPAERATEGRTLASRDAERVLQRELQLRIAPLR